MRTFTRDQMVIERATQQKEQWDERVIQHSV